MLPPLVDYAGERGVRLMIENCVMEGWHPDGYPGNLAYSPELWEWMFDLGLWLNFDPSHLLWIGIDPVAALKPYVDRVIHAHAKDAETFPAERNRFGFFGRTSTREADPWDMGWWRFRIPGLGEVDWRRYVDTLYEGGFDRRALGRARGPGLGRHPGAGRGRARARPPQPATAGGALMAVAAPAAAKVLEVRGLVKEYPGVRALQGVDFEVLEGEVHCLLGPNGAGKSTLIKCVSGAVEPTEGEISVGGEPLPEGDPAATLGRGVATIYQELDLVEDLTVAQSIFLAHEPRRGPFLDLELMRRESATLLERLGHGAIDPRAPVRALRPAAQQVVSIARALSHDVRLLIMDEPSAILDEGEIETLFEVVRRLTAEGVGVVYITHRLDEIRRIGDRVTVLSDGRTAATGIPATTSTDELVELMVGHKVEQLYPERPAGTDQVLLEARGLRRLPMVRGVSFEVRAGEVLGPRRAGGLRAQRAAAADLRDRRARGGRGADRGPAPGPRTAPTGRSPPGSGWLRRTASPRACCSTGA